MAGLRKNRTKKSGSRLRAFSKRARVFLVICLGALAVGFVALPLWMNGYLFENDLPEAVHAASRQATPLPAATLQPMPVVNEAPLVASATSLSGDVLFAQATPSADVGYVTLQLEDDSDAVAALQARLMETGYFEYDEVTTYYGTVTQSAVSLFQRVAGLPQTGVADAPLQALLFSENVPAYCMRQGDKGSDVRGMQARLTELGYYSEKVNGYFGVATHRAVLKFQARNNLDETGVVDHTQRDLLYSASVRPLVDPTPTPTLKPTPTQKPTPRLTQAPTEKPTKAPIYDIPVLEEEETDVPAIPTPTKTPKPTPTPEEEMDAEEDEPSYGSGVNALIAAAKAQLGKPYVWSEESPEAGFDCSGLVYYCLRQAGVRTSRFNALKFSQVESWEAVTSLSKCKKGDLLFYKSDTNSNVNHTGIYLGNGTFIHASSSKGEVMISNTTGYYERNFVIARRVF